MLNSDAAPVSFRSEAPYQMERGVDTVLRLRPSRAGEGITPTSATVTITDASGVAVVTAAAASVATAGQATYTALGATNAAMTIGRGWGVTWSVLLPGETVARVVRCEGALILSRLYAVVGETDLFRRARRLDPTAPGAISRETDYSTFLDDAWQTIMDRLDADELRPWLILSPQSLREAHITLTLALVFDDFAAAGGQSAEAFMKMAANYRQQYTDTWGNFRPVYDRSQTGSVATGERAAPRGFTFLGTSLGARRGW